MTLRRSASGTWKVVDSVTDLPTDNGEDVQYLTTNELAFQSLDEEEYSVESLDAYLPDDGIDSVTRRNAEVASAICERLDAQIHEELPEVPQDCNPFDALCYQLKHVLDGLSFRFVSLSSFLADESPEVLTVPPSMRARFETPPTDAASQPFSWKPYESATARLLDDSYWSDAFDVRLDRQPMTDSVMKDRRASGSRGTLQRIFDPLADELVPSIARFGYDLLAEYTNENRLSGLTETRLRGLKQGGDRPIVVVGWDRGVLAFVEQALRERDAPVDWWTHWNEPPVSTRTSRSMQRFQRGSHPSWSDIDHKALEEMVDTSIGHSLPEPIATVLKDRLVRFGRSQLGFHLRLYQRAIRYFNDRNVLAAVCGTMASSGSQMIAQAAKQTQTEFVSFQHGGNYGYVRLTSLEFADLKAPDLFATYGDGVTRTLQSRVDDSNLSTDVTTIGWSWEPTKTNGGSADTLCGEGPDPTLMYVSTSMLGDARYGPQYWQSDHRYHLHQRRLVDLLDRTDRYDAVFKLHTKGQYANPIASYIRTNASDVRMLRTPDLADVLPAVDVVVIDWPSTVLLETLALEIPTIYLDLGWLSWIAEAREMLKEEVLWLDRTADGWEDRFLNALERGSRLPRPTGRFLDSYGRTSFHPEVLWRRWSA